MPAKTDIQAIINNLSSKKELSGLVTVLFKSHEPVSFDTKKWHFCPL